jgi:hypothetical protein
MLHVRRAGESISLSEVTSRTLNSNRTASELERHLDAASRVTSVSRFPGEAMADVGAQARRALSYSRVTYGDVASFDAEPSRFVVFPRQGSEVTDPALTTTRTTTVSRTGRETTTLLDRVFRSATTSRLGAEWFPTVDAATRALAAVRLGTEVSSGEVGSAVRSALLHRMATEIVSTDLVTSRSASVSRVAMDHVTMADTTGHLLMVRRTTTDYLSSLLDTATRTRIYRLPHAPFPEPYDIEQGDLSVYDLLLKKGRIVEIILGVQPALAFDTLTGRVYTIVQDDHEFASIGLSDEP